MALKQNMLPVNPLQIPWFADTAPNLLTNKTIRDFLGRYSQQQWPEVVKLVLVWAIMNLEQQYRGRNLSLKELKELARATGAVIVVDRSVPQLQQQILGLQANLDSVFDALALQV